MENLLPYIREISIVIGWIVSLIVFQTKVKSSLAHQRKEINEVTNRINRLEMEFRQKIGKIDNVIDTNEKACKDTLKDVAVLEFQFNVLNEELSKVRTNTHAFANQTHDAITKLAADINIVKGQLRINV